MKPMNIYLSPVLHVEEIETESGIAQSGSERYGAQGQAGGNIELDDQYLEW
jgi:hypothetical protein